MMLEALKGDAGAGGGVRRAEAVLTKHCNVLKVFGVD